MRFASHLGIQHSGAPRPNTTNAEGHPAFKETLKQSIARVAFTGVLADSYYGKEDEQAKELIPLCLEAATECPGFLLNAAKASRKANFKLFPKLALGALISKTSGDKIEPEAINILKTYSAGQLLELALILKAKEFGKGLGSRPQRILGAALVGRETKRLEDMTLSDRQDMRRLLRLLHPKGEPKPVLTYCLGDDAKPATDRQAAMLAFPTSEQQHRLIELWKLPFNATKGCANKEPATWTAIRDNMSPLQILLNLKALDERGVMDPVWLKTFLDGVDIDRTRLVPHDILRPLGMIYDTKHPREYRETLTNFLARLACRPLPGLGDKRVGILLDFSGSMAPGNPFPSFGSSQLGNWVLAVTLAAPIMAGCPNRHLAFFGDQACFEGQSIAQSHVFGHNIQAFPYLKGCPTEAAFHNLLGLNPAMSTNVAAGFDLFHTNNIPLDVLFLFTDEQQNGNVSGVKAWNNYRAKVSPKARLVVVNVSNTKWHMANATDPSITIIQSVTPLVFDQFSRFDQSAVQMIENWQS